MPELPEVERAAAILRRVAVGKRVESVESFEDTIVFSDTSHTEFAAELTGREITKAARYGKVFYMELDGDGRMPVLHFGMTGMLQVKGEQPLIYGDKKRNKPLDTWPPRFTKFILNLSNGESDTEPTSVAFTDARRLARIRLCAKPLKEPPISELGFDPILSMPIFDDFQTAVTKRKCPIKALLLNQSFSAGVGNWVADEVLYHARIHPEHRCNTLDEAHLLSLHTELSNVCKTAVAVDADSSKFPENWLFKHRWGKGKKEHNLKLPSGEPATIKFITVGGRTSAFVTELQLPPGKIEEERAEEQDELEVPPADDSSDLTDLESDSAPEPPKKRTKRKTKISDEQPTEGARKRPKRRKN